MEIELVLDAKALLAEGPCWDCCQHLLYWVDIKGRRVCIYNPKTNLNQQFAIDQYVGCIALRKSGGAILALENGFYFFDPEKHALFAISNPESHLTTNRFNDGKGDAAGRFWAGTMEWPSSIQMES